MCHFSPDVKVFTNGTETRYSVTKSFSPTTCSWIRCFKHLLEKRLEQGLPCAFILFGSSEDAGVWKHLFALLKAAKVSACFSLFSFNYTSFCPFSDCFSLSYLYWWLNRKWRSGEHCCLCPRCVSFVSVNLYCRVLLLYVEDKSA